MSICPGYKPKGPGTHRLFNDNHGDWDMAPSKARLWENLEVISWLRRLGFDQRYCIYMERADPAGARRQSVHNMGRAYRLAENLPRDEILVSLRRTDRPANLQLPSDGIVGAIW